MRNPIALASGAGLLVSATGLRPPTRFSLEAPPYLYGQCTYILWLVHIREGKLALAARACDELRVHALAHAHRDKAYIRCFALAARGTIDLGHDSGHPGRAELVRWRKDELLREDARAALAEQFGLDDADRFYALVAQYASGAPPAASGA